LQWLIGKREIQNDEEITNEGILSQAMSNAKKEYKIFGCSFCQLGFKNVFCVGNHMLERLNRLRNQDVIMPKPVGMVQTIISYILES
jgi:hypothetical protein